MRVENQTKTLIRLAQVYAQKQEAATNAVADF
jgi:hypothetical protein